MNANHNYDNKVFTNIQNTDNGEVNSETLFYYHQNEDIVWAEYNGGSIKKGFLLGFVRGNGELVFHYQHINLHGEIRTGKCHSTPRILDDGRMELVEKWAWTNGDKSSGESTLIEVC
ncbi:MAG: n-acetylglutamate synthase [Proteobacteria bacterium]|nr:hypothetical protein [Cystobacterineae bacterium]MCL2259132.1 hypothetical protein [Cystobacterineae bacterium]MCL2315295.1 n-acetylglutamate synthase [Pseudomonadota bacterium]